MKTRHRAWTLILAVLFAAPLLAHEGHVHKMRGTVSKIEEAQLLIQTKDRQDVVVALTQETRYLKGTSPASASDIEVGTRVGITTIEKDGKLIAQEVRIGSTTKEAKAQSQPQD